MARKLRSDPDDGWHHVMNRGHRRNPVFLDDQDRRSFLHLVRKAFAATEVELASYCLMGNHFHLVAHCPTSGLSTAMQRLSSQYTRAFNTRHGGDGPLFRGRFASVLATSDQQLLAVVRYVHRNPLELRVNPSAYPWSSYPAYLSGTEPSWLSTRFVLDLQGGRADHQRFVEARQPADKFHLSHGRTRIHEDALRPLRVA